MDPDDELGDRLDELDSGQPIMTVSRSGGRGGTMAEFVTERGYRADHLDGGIQAWANAGLPMRSLGDERPGKVA